MANNVLFTSKAIATGGRDGHVESDNGVIDVDLKNPSGDEVLPYHSNPEQLFAAGYAACFDGALSFMASKSREKIESKIEAAVSLLKDSSDNGFKLGVLLEVEIKGADQSTAEELVEKAHEFCPYSKATRGNVDVSLKVTAK